MEFPIQYLIPVIASIASFAVAGVYTMWVLRQNPGTKQMTDISDAVKVGAAAFLKRELKIIIPIAIGLSIVIGFFFQEIGRAHV